MRDRFLKTQTSFGKLDRGIFSAADYLKLREEAHGAHGEMKKILEELTVPKLVYYSPEGDLDVNSPLLTQPSEGLISLYLSDMRNIQAGNIDYITERIQSEAKTLERRMAFAERGMQALAALAQSGYRHSLVV